MYIAILCGALFSLPPFSLSHSPSLFPSLPLSPSPLTLSLSFSVVQLECGVVEVVGAEVVGVVSVAEETCSSEDNSKVTHCISSIFFVANPLISSPNLNFFDYGSITLVWANL